MFWLTLGIIISALGGLLLTLYIKKHRYSEDHKTCPLGQSCAPIINGKFSRFLGMPIEALGSAFYITIATIYTVSLFRAVPNPVLLAGLLLSGAGLAFSVYLTLVQVFGIKKWCTVSLGSAAIVFLITVLAFMGYDYAFVEFAYTSKQLLEWLYMTGVIVGTLATTLYAHTFIKFLKDFEISRKEERRLEMFSQGAWAALGLTFLSGLTLAITDTWRAYTDSTVFIVLVIIIAMLIVYEIIVNVIITPRLIDLHFGDDEKYDDHKHGMQRHFAFVMMGAGVVSWYALLVFSYFKWFEYSSGQIFLMYLGALIVSTLIVGVVEKMIYKKSLLYRDDSKEKTEEK